MWNLNDISECVSWDFVLSLFCNPKTNWCKKKFLAIYFTIN